MKILILGCSDITIRKIMPTMRKIKNLSFDIASKSKIEKNMDTKIIAKSAHNEEGARFWRKGMKTGLCF